MEIGEEELKSDASLNLNFDPVLEQSNWQSSNGQRKTCISEGANTKGIRTKGSQLTDHCDVNINSL
ncbi:hypothetical protein DQQ10_12850 [Pseudochryseolinea flava]|uniref:Uncharacterized protein n=1 Tax=Pseudochryseolinea flava TaxID=2059302 RepID=A0A364Y4Z1_9BACT|nr:hypothetical protein DQQ10_12850 [Pseudochryseolinea flava]